VSGGLLIAAGLFWAADQRLDPADVAVLERIAL
jgi:hypothetical protein